MNVIALACVAMIDRPIAYQGIVFPARKYLAAVVEPRPRHSPYDTMQASHANRTTQSSVLMAGMLA